MSVNTGTVSGYAKLQLFCTDFLGIFVAFTVDDKTVAVAMKVAHPLSVCGVSQFSGELFWHVQ
jgi:hypothetical protein